MTWGSISDSRRLCGRRDCSSSVKRSFGSNRFFHRRIVEGEIPKCFATTSALQLFFCAKMNHSSRVRALALSAFPCVRSLDESMSVCFFRTCSVGKMFHGNYTINLIYLQYHYDLSYLPNLADLGDLFSPLGQCPIRTGMSLSG